MQQESPPSRPQKAYRLQYILSREGRGTPVLLGRYSWTGPGDTLRKGPRKNPLCSTVFVFSLQETKAIFTDSTSYTVLMDLLFESGMIAECIKVFDTTKGNKEMSLNRDAFTLYTAALAKLVSFVKVSNIYRHMHI